MTELLQKSKGKPKNLHKPLPLYRSDLEYILDELKCLDLLLHIQVLKAMDRHSPSPLDSFKGIVISDEEIIGLLAQPDNPNDDLSADTQLQINQLTQQLERAQAEVKKRCEVSIKDGLELRLPMITNMFQLSEFAKRCLIICLAPELDVKYEKLYAYLQDDVTRKKPTVDFVLKLLCATQQERVIARSHFREQSPLLQHNLLYLPDHLPDHDSSLLASPLKLDEGILEFLLGSDQLDRRLSSAATLLTSFEPSYPNFYNTKLEQRITDYVSCSLAETEAGDGSIVFHLHGPSGSQKRTLVKNVFGKLRTPLIIADINKMMQQPQPFKTLAHLLCREAKLRSAALCLTNIDCLLSLEGHEYSELNSLLEDECRPQVTFLLGNQAWLPGNQHNIHYIDIEIPIPDAAARKDIWERLQPSIELENVIDFGELAEKYRFTAGQIQDVIQRAKLLAAWRSPSKVRINKEDLQKACQQAVEHKLDTMATKINPKHTMDDLVLPYDQIRRIENIISQMKYRHQVLTEWNFNKRLSYGKGLNVLFCGPPGTGKTMAAEVIARELGLDLYKLDLSQVVSKYIGETEKNLRRLFDEARSSYSILFFDEADALFGKRSEVKDAHDRYANTEVAFLLQKMEEYEGMSILATNLHNNLDDAFIRRIHYRVDFPIPEEEYRRQLWQSMFPEEAPRSDDIDFPFLSKKFKLAGGSIKNIVLSAAYLAAESAEPIRMKHIIRAAKHELDKMGKLSVKEDFGPYYDDLY